VSGTTVAAGPDQRATVARCKARVHLARSMARRCRARLTFCPESNVTLNSINE